MMDGNFRKKIALKLKEPPPTSTLSPTVAVDQIADVTNASSPSNDTNKVSSSTTTCDVSVLNTTTKINLTQDLNWDQPVNIVGRAVKDPLIHICEICDRPILIYGRMKKCRHAFCRECVKRASGECPKCHNNDQAFEEASMGSVHICTFGGGRYDNKGCGRSYLSQRDLEAHIAYRHKKAATTATSNFPSLQIPHTFFQSSSAPGGNLPHAFQSQLFPQPGSAAIWTRPPGYQ